MWNTSLWVRYLFATKRYEQIPRFARNDNELAS
jgi:hypothetical protein